MAEAQNALRGPGVLVHRQEPVRAQQHLRQLAEASDELALEHIEHAIRELRAQASAA